MRGHERAGDLDGTPDRSPRRVVITGIGPVTASGTGVDRFWDALRGSISPIGPLTRFDASPFRTRIAAEVHDFEPTDFMDRKAARRSDRFAQFAVAATRVALDDAAISSGDVEPGKVAVQMGSALGGIAHAQDQMLNFYARGVRGVDPRLATTVYCGAASCRVAIEHGFTGPNSTNAMSCASGTIAIADGFRLIRDGVADVAVCGGVEAPLGPLSFGAFAIIRAMSTRNDDPARACRPFDQDRDGFVMGEGACVLVLEELGRAVERGGRIYAEISGFGVTNDAHHMTAPRPDASQTTEAMRLALESGGLDPGAVDYVNAHGSSTPLNDCAETLAIHKALGERAWEIPVTATKPYYGHALGASGAIEAAVTALVLRRGWIPPTLNLDEAGEGCDLDYVPKEGREEGVACALTNSFGFGGINASIAMVACNGSGTRSPRVG